MARLLLILGLLAGPAVAQEPALDLAKDLYAHKLPDRAKELFITIVHTSKGSDAEKAEALYWLGQISFEEQSYAVALSDWKKLIEVYPASAQAQEISQRLSQLREIVGQVADATISSAVVGSYIRNGEFWSEASEIFSIDSSYLNASVTFRRQFCRML